MLAFRTMNRGLFYGLPSGQAVAKALQGEAADRARGAQPRARLRARHAPLVLRPRRGRAGRRRPAPRPGRRRDRRRRAAHGAREDAGLRAPASVQADGAAPRRLHHGRPPAVRRRLQPGAAEGAPRRAGRGRRRARWRRPRRRAHAGAGPGRRPGAVAPDRRDGPPPDPHDRARDVAAGHGRRRHRRVPGRARPQPAAADDGDDGRRARGADALRGAGAGLRHARATRARRCGWSCRPGHGRPAWAAAGGGVGGDAAARRGWPSTGRRRRRSRRARTCARPRRPAPRRTAGSRCRSRRPGRTPGRSSTRC